MVRKSQVVKSVVEDTTAKQVFDENNKLIIPATEQAVIQEKVKTIATKTKVKESVRRKAGGTSEQLKQREKWRQTYQRLKPKYREWNRRYRENLKAKKLAEQKKSKKKVTQKQ